jgi:hypothetical protein
VHRSITLVDLQLEAQNSFLFIYNTFIKILYMFRELPCSSSGRLCRNCIYAASGIFTLYAHQMPKPVTAPCSGLVADTSMGFEKTFVRLTLQKMSSSSQTLFNVTEYIYIYIYIHTTHTHTHTHTHTDLKLSYCFV